MSDLTERLRALAEKCWEYPYNIDVPLTDAKLAAIDALHRKVIRLTTGDHTVCPTCDEDTYGLWPCDTARILHPKEEQ